jgi:CheY-like chemotaxis protein
MTKRHTHGAADGPPRPHGLGREGLSVLVVEDHRDTAGSLEQLLKAAGHRVRLAPDGAQALEALADGLPDVVILDVSLPDMSGQELARRVAAAAGRTPPLVVALADQPGHEGRSDEAGIDLHLLKPVDPDRLLAVLRRYRDGLSALAAGRRKDRR